MSRQECLQPDQCSRKIGLIGCSEEITRPVGQRSLLPDRGCVFPNTMGTLSASIPAVVDLWATPTRIAVDNDIRVKLKYT